MTSGSLAGGASNASDRRAEWDESMAFLTGLAAAVVEDSRVRPGESVAGHGPNWTGGTLIRPGWRNCYPAFWIRDFAMSLDSGLITPEEAIHALLLTAQLQAPQDRFLPSGSFVPRGAIADHITFGGEPIFYPGTLDDAEAQGQPFGYYPSLDDHFYFVEMAWHAIVVCGREDLLRTSVAGVPFLERLALAFAVPQVDPESELVVCDEQRRGVSFGFTDTVVHTGKLLFCSLLRYRAAVWMADLLTRAGDRAAAERYARIAATISSEIPRTFAHDGGLLVASTGPERAARCLGIGVCCGDGCACRACGDPCSRRDQTSARVGHDRVEGNVRHVPTDADFNTSTAWERVVGQQSRNRYQNGAYWGTPVGWVCEAVAPVAPAVAERLALDYVADLREGDYRQGPAYGAPWECMHPSGDHRQSTGLYVLSHGASWSLPPAGLGATLPSVRGHSRAKMS